MEKISFERGKKFDLQLTAALDDEHALAGIIDHAKIELKSETWQWEQTGNICIEFEHNGKPSGIAATEADFWVHELKRDGQTLVYLWFPIDRLKQLCRSAYANGRWRDGAGDGGKSKVILLALREILK